MLRFSLFLTFFIFLLSQAIAAPKVVVSIKPIHSIVAGIMQGVGEPDLLLNGNASPHDYNLKPSQAQSIQDAGLIIWVGKELETFLQKPLANRGTEANVIELIDIEGLEIYSLRTPHEHEGEAHDDDHDEHHDEQKHEAGNTDPHIWLGINNAITIKNEVVRSLSQIDPENADQYRKNGLEIDRKLLELDTHIRLSTGDITSKSYVVFHDAYQYFEKHFKLKAPITITIHPEVPPGAARIKNIRHEVVENNITCLFSEPQFSPKVMQTIAENTNIKIATLDPLGSNIEEGPGHYFTTITTLADNFSKCLKH